MQIDEFGARDGLGDGDGLEDSDRLEADDAIEEHDTPHVDGVELDEALLDESDAELDAEKEAELQSMRTLGS